MRQGDWDEIVQHPDRPLTRGQVELLRAQNIAALTPERRSALCVRLLIEVDNLTRVPSGGGGLVNVSVIVATHGDIKWSHLAQKRALPSVEDCGFAQVIEHHAPLATLAQVRNTAAEVAHEDWLCFLDADDELEPGYLDAMADAFADQREWLPYNEGEAPQFADPARLYVPRVRRVYGPGNAAAPEVPNKGRWPRVNECVIGTLVRADLFRAVGGFRDFTDRGRRILMYEDWDLWLRCWNSGAELVYVHDAIYREHVAPTGRNTNAHEAEMVYAAIWRDHEADKVLLGR